MLNKILQELWYHGIVYCHFAYNSGGKFKSYLVSLLRYGYPDLPFMGTLKNKLQICQKYEPSHCEFEVRCYFRGAICSILENLYIFIILI